MLSIHSIARAHSVTSGDLALPTEWQTGHGQIELESRGENFAPVPNEAFGHQDCVISARVGDQQRMLASIRTVTDTPRQCAARARLLADGFLLLSLAMDDLEDAPSRVWLALVSEQGTLEKQWTGDVQRAPRWSKAATSAQVTAALEAAIERSLAQSDVASAERNIEKLAALTMTKSAKLSRFREQLSAQRRNLKATRAVSDLITGEWTLSTAPLAEYNGRFSGAWHLGDDGSAIVETPWGRARGRWRAPYDDRIQITGFGANDIWLLIEDAAKFTQDEAAGTHSCSLALHGAHRGAPVACKIERR